ncbi:MAG TPA: MBL fold metallo-hydrolase [Acetobacteraceae bacterium]
MIHRFRISAMQATIISDGPLTLPAPADIFSGPPPEAVASVLREGGLPTDAVRVEQNCLLIEVNGRRALFDNGLGSAKLYGPDSGRLLDSLAEAEVDPASIDTLVLTHAHSDHCWGTMGDDGKPNLPNAEIVMAQAEMEFWTSAPRGVGRRSIAGVRTHLVPLRERIRYVADGGEVLEGVQAWSTPGHTPGHMAFLFDGGGGARWCLSGDVAFHHPISYAFPEAESLFDTDRAQGAATRRRVLDRLAAERLLVIGYHHPWPGLGRVERAGTAFRFIPDGDDS